MENYPLVSKTGKVQQQPMSDLSMKQVHYNNNQSWTYRDSQWVDSVLLVNETGGISLLNLHRDSSQQEMNAAIRGPMTNGL